jgi:hypothetical protein
MDLYTVGSRRSTYTTVESSKLAVFAAILVLYTIVEGPLESLLESLVESLFESLVESLLERALHREE